jgi:hypothetical protein
MDDFLVLKKFMSLAEAQISKRKLEERGLKAIIETPGRSMKITGAEGSDEAELLVKKQDFRIAQDLLGLDTSEEI